ncbi:MAG: TIGR03960 family B12-binding radical SAM protein [Endomicrobiia bacterium]
MIEKYLSLVKKPSRYINSELNSVKKNTAKLKFCFCFPDLYEIGASNLGIEILYHIVNNRDDSLAERAFCPDTDLEEIMKRENIELFSLETETPLRYFDIIGFSLQYELSFTNILTILDLSKIPFFAKDRNNGNYPLIIAGGPVCFNPEPVADFFDLFVIGEAEDVIHEIIDCFIKNKFSKEPKNKDKLLYELSRIEGVYVPGVHKDKQNLSIKNRIVDLEKSYYPTKPIIPYVQTVHNRLNLEISRGCVYNCKFCQATNIYRPWRERSTETILKYLTEGIKNTGYERVTLSSFSVSSYSEIENLLREVSNCCISKKVSLSVPSLRCDEKSKKILQYLVFQKKTNLTFAIEAGSQRLRNIIGKNIKDEDIFETIKTAYALGWRAIKLYFMIGLPTETFDDIESIINLVNKLFLSFPKIRFNITISPFVPKPHTPFQFEKMEDIETLIQKKKILSKKLRGNLKFHNIYMSKLEGIFSRGDKSLSKLIVLAWQKGAKFDHWHERFNYEIWNESIKELNIEPEIFLRKREHSETLPWDFIKLS